MNRNMLSQLLLLWLLLIPLFIFLVFIYVPANLSVNWIFPLGWDAPAYLSWARYIKEHGYVYTVIQERYPFGSHLLLVLTSYFVHEELTTAWHYVYTILLFLTMIGVFHLYVACFRSKAWAFVAAALFPYLVSTYYIFGALLQQMAFMSILPFIYVAIGRYVDNPSCSRLINVAVFLFFSFFFWPWSSLVPIIVLAAAILVPSIEKVIKIKLFIIALSFAGLVGTWWYGFYLPVLSEYILKSGLKNVRPLGSLSRNTPFTFEEFIDRTFNGSVLLFILFISSLLSVLLQLSVRGSHVLLKLGKVKENRTTFIVSMSTLMFLIIIAIGSASFDEISRRFSPLILQNIWLTYIFQTFVVKIKSRKHKREKFLGILFATILILSMLICLNPYNEKIAKIRGVWWRIWYEEDATNFFNILRSAREYYDRFGYSDDVVVIVPVTRKIVYPVPFSFYIKSFFPNSVVAYLSDKNLRSAESYSSLYSNLSFPYEHWSVTIDGKSLKDYPTGWTKMLILLVQGYFEPEPGTECYQRFKESGYCLYMLKP
jgi:hypothetical protein